MNAETISIIVFYSALALIIFFNRKKLQVIDKIFFVFRWDKGAELIKKFSSKFFKVLYTLAIPVCIFFMFYGIKIMIDGAVTISESDSPTSTVGLAIPGVKIPGSSIYIPFWYGIISLAIIVFVHELSHGLAAVSDKINLKSTGAGLLLFLPLAFVEPDEKSYNSAGWISKLRMLSAGSFANIATAFIAIILILYVMYPMIESMVDYTGITITGTSENSPAFNAGIINYSKILMVNNYSINNITDFYNALYSMAPYDNVTVATNYSTYTFQTSANPDNSSLAYLGVFVEQDWEYKQELQSLPLVIIEFPTILTALLLWIYNLSLSVGVFNLYPLWITDGGKIVLEITKKFVKDEKKAFAISNSVFLICFGVLMYNFVGPFFINSINALF